MDHDKLEKHEGCEVKVKTCALKSKHDTAQEEEFQSEDDEDDTLIENFEKILGNKKTKEMIQREASTLRKKVTWFKYVKSGCPTLQKKIKVNNKKDRKSKREYVAWKYNKASSSLDEGQENMALMASLRF